MKNRQDKAHKRGGSVLADSKSVSTPLAACAFLFLLLPLLAQAATYTACWDPVQPTEHYDGLAYMICVDASDPTTLTPSAPIGCAGMPYFTPTTTISFSATSNAWIRTRAVIWDQAANGAMTNLRWGPYSQTQQIIAGITPPVVGCSCP